MPRFLGRLGLVESYANPDNILLSPLYSTLYLIIIYYSSRDYRDQKGTHHIPLLKQGPMQI